MRVYGRERAAMPRLPQVLKAVVPVILTLLLPFPLTFAQEEPVFLRGDANGDVEVDISDAVRMLLWLFRGSEPLPCQDAADVNDDGRLAVTDPIALLDFLFRAKAEPAYPGPYIPGLDPTPDGLKPCQGPAVTSVVGRVTDRVTGAPLKGVLVTIASRSTRTNEAGRFWLREIPPGAQTLVVDATSLDPSLFVRRLPVEVRPNRVVDVGVIALFSDTDPPVVTITDPTDQALFSRSPITVTGFVDDEEATVVVNGIPVSLLPGKPGTFRIQVPLTEGANLIRAEATDEAGNAGFATVKVLLDTTPPTVFIETPKEGAVLTAPQVDVAGTINDLVTGTTINVDDVQVTVNGTEAAVSNRTFVVPGLPLSRGMNNIMVEARDRAGNVARATTHVSVQDQAGQRLVLVSGNNQSGVVGTELPEPLVVALIGADGGPVAERRVDFSVSRGDGRLKAFPQEGQAVLVQTDEQGQARLLLALGSRTGAGNNRVIARADGFVGEVEFCFMATQALPRRIVATSGDQQQGLVGKPLPLPFVILVTDGTNPVEGVEVLFTVTQGDGTLDGASSFKRRTDADGQAQAVLTLGQTVGPGTQVVTASFEGLQESPAVFTASAGKEGPPEDTVVAGIVLDTQDQPVPDATVRIEGTELSTRTDGEGRFTLRGVPVGPIRLIVDGTTTTRPGEWFEFRLDLVTLPGQVYSIARPIYLLPVDAENSRIVGGPENVTLTLKGVPGATLTVFANSVTCPDGSRQCRVSWTQVNMEHMPVAPPLGSIAMLAWTVKPIGVRFNPPAKVCIPNMDMPPGQQVDMFSYDAELGDWVNLGPATVTPDGKQICSDPGFGVVKTNQGCCVPPPPPKKCIVKPSISIAFGEVVGAEGGGGGVGLAGALLPVGGSLLAEAIVRPDLPECPISGPVRWSVSDPGIVELSTVVGSTTTLRGRRPGEVELSGFIPGARTQARVRVEEATEECVVLIRVRNLTGSETGNLRVAILKNGSQVPGYANPNFRFLSGGGFTTVVAVLAARGENRITVQAAGTFEPAFGPLEEADCKTTLVCPEDEGAEAFCGLTFP